MEVFTIWNITSGAQVKGTAGDYEHHQHVGF